MRDQAIQEAAGHVTGAANSIELAIGEIMAAFREGRFGPEPVGSPGYVRRLRDEAVVAALSALMTDPLYDRTERFAASNLALEQANALMVALGYQVPEETP